MRVLWFASSCDYVLSLQKAKGNGKGRGYNGGGWMPSLLNEVKQREGIEMGVCFATNGQPFKAEQNGVTYYPFPNHKKPWKDKVLDLVYYRHPERDRILWNQYTDDFKRVIDDFQPDVIEIFGSELYMGLAIFVAPCPVVLHVQGLLSLYIYMVSIGGV